MCPAATVALAPLVPCLPDPPARPYLPLPTNVTPSAHTHTRLPACLPAHLPACLPTCLLCPPHRQLLRGCGAGLARLIFCAACMGDTPPLQPGKRDGVQRLASPWAQL